MESDNLLEFIERAFREKPEELTALDELQKILDETKVKEEKYILTFSASN